MLQSIVWCLLPLIKQHASIGIMPTISSNKVASSAGHVTLASTQWRGISAPINAGLMPDAFAAYYYDQSKVDPKSKVCYTIFMYISQLNHKSQLEHQNSNSASASPPVIINSIDKFVRTQNQLPP